MNITNLSMGDSMIMNFDESGNFGRQGRYVVIASVNTKDIKPLVNVMKKATLKVKSTFPAYSNKNEIKASESSPCIKDFILRKICSKENINVRYVVADLQAVKQSLKNDENLLYNYMLSFLIDPVAKDNNNPQVILNLDKRSIKVKSANSFEDYIKLKFNYDQHLPTSFNVNYIESQNSYAIQAADFVANAIYSKYEYGRDYFYDIIAPKVVQSVEFPKWSFKNNVVQIKSIK